MIHSADRTGLKIALCDDNSDMRTVLHTVFDIVEGHSVVAEAASAEEAEALVEPAVGSAAEGEPIIDVFIIDSDMLTVESIRKLRDYNIAVRGYSARYGVPGIPREDFYEKGNLPGLTRSLLELTLTREHS